MPKAIISSNHSKDFMSSSNIYNIIPKIIPTKQYSHLNTESKANFNSQKTNGFKKININPNLSEDESQTYKGGNREQTNLQQRKQITSQIQAQQQQPQQQQQQQPQIKQIYTNSKSFKLNQSQNQPQPQIQPQQINNTPIISELEQKRRILQEQQLRELAKLKYKKEQIQKINNRKKEIELIRSIDNEKEKLRLIHNKQNQLNNIINQQINQSNISDNSRTTQNTQKQHTIYNFDAKKTKKNLEQYKDVVKLNKPNSINTNIPNNIDSIKIDKIEKVEKDVVDKVIRDKDVVDKVDKIDKVDKDVVDKVISDKVEKDIVDKVVRDKAVVDKVEKAVVDKVEKDVVDKVEKDIVDKVEKKKTTKSNSNKPYKYYTKKDVPELKWISKSELYDSSTFTENLEIYLGIQPLFNKKQMVKNKTTLDEKKNILLDTYNFKHIDKFKDNVINLISLILEYNINLQTMSYKEYKNYLDNKNITLDK